MRFVRKRGGWVGLVWGGFAQAGGKEEDVHHTGPSSPPDEESLPPAESPLAPLSEPSLSPALAPSLPLASESATALSPSSAVDAEERAHKLSSSVFLLGLSACIMSLHSCGADCGGKASSSGVRHPPPPQQAGSRQAGPASAARGTAMLALTALKPHDPACQAHTPVAVAGCRAGGALGLGESVSADVVSQLGLAVFHLVAQAGFSRLLVCMREGWEILSRGDPYG